MKITSAQYAKTLYDLTKDKTQDQVNGVIIRFVEVLNKNGKLRMADDIMKKFGDIYNKDNKIVEAEVVSREKLSRQLVDGLTGFIKNKYNAEEVVIENIVDSAIKGGVIIRVGDEIMDGSVERQLINLKKRLVL